MKVLVTGGAGYIGRTVVSALEENGHIPIILDSLVTGRLEYTEGKIFYKGDIADRDILAQIFKDHPEIKHCIHFAALIVVPDSVANPYEYYTENVAKSLDLFKNLNEFECKNVIFSSSASVYDVVEGFKVTESAPLKPSSPYARTKFMMEMVLEDFCRAYGMHGIALRYFNPIGADPKLRSGAHVQFPSHVLAKLLEAASSEDALFNITGVNWPTRDGSGIRDYIHVWDLAMAHVKAVENFDQAFAKSENPEESYLVINIGTGNGVTVKELVSIFEGVLGRPVNKAETEARPGDVAGSYASCDRAKKLIGWEAQYSIEDGIRDAFRWDEIRETILNYN
ncbi:UDP-glucose 4-epimerase GalE [Turicibacter sanguinis]|uniref:UDP-glucose 4-epimerase GalE n=1 Tax=Turicibacter sanguinis TaxID=154288 RepID=UPI0039926D31